MCKSPCSPTTLPLSEHDDLPCLGEVGKHDWAINAPCEDGYLAFVDDRPLSYRKTKRHAIALALEVIERLVADGDYRLGDKPQGFCPAATTQEESRLVPKLGDQERIVVKGIAYEWSEPTSGYWTIKGAPLMLYRHMLYA